MISPLFITEASGVASSSEFSRRNLSFVVTVSFGAVADGSVRATTGATVVRLAESWEGAMTRPRTIPRNNAAEATSRDKRRRCIRR
jgi:hypothetical protein